MNKPQLLDSIRNGHRLFKELLAGFSNEQMQPPGVIGKWSVKDTVAHIVIHEQRMIEWMRERLQGKCPETYQPYAMPDDELDKLNEEIYQENLNRSLEDVMSDLDQAYAEALRLVETSLEEDLLDPAPFQLQGGEPLWEAIAANTFSHYQEHGKDLTDFKNLLGLVP